jgi:hypothetical protein
MPHIEEIWRIGCSEHTLEDTKTTKIRQRDLKLANCLGSSNVILGLTRGT